MPPRTALCLACRTALAPGEACDLAPGHEVADVGTERGRERLITAAWGTPEERERVALGAARARRLVGVLGVGGAAGGSLAAWLAFTAAVPDLLALGLAGGLTSYTGGWLSLRRRALPAPAGAGALAAFDGTRAAGPRGIVDGPRRVVSPACGVDCVAYALELQFAGPGGSRVMFRDAVTSGFEVVLESGGVAAVPPGRIRLLGPMRQAIDFDNRAIEDLLRDFDAAHDPSRLFDPLRYNVVAEAVLVPGDRIQIASTFEPEVDPRAAAGGYRDPVSSVLTPRVVPVLRPLGPVS